MKDVRKSIHALIVEYNENRGFYGKVFHHKETLEDYQLLYPAWDERTNEKLAVYCLCAMSRLKFTMPFAEFLETFDEGAYLQIQAMKEAQNADKAGK